MSLYFDNFTAFNFNANGWLGGLTAGAQIQSGHTVIGMEGDRLDEYQRLSQQ